jgi:hypothetical protein
MGKKRVGIVTWEMPVVVLMVVVVVLLAAATAGVNYGPHLLSSTSQQEATCSCITARMWL